MGEGVEGQRRMSGMSGDLLNLRGKGLEGGFVRVVDSEHMSGADNGLHIEVKWVMFKY